MKTILLLALLAAAVFARANTNSTRLTRPLSLAEAQDLALQQNSTLLKSRADLEAAYGIVVQTRAIALPRVQISSDYQANEESSIDRFRPRGGASNNVFANAFDFADQRWSANARIVQSIYEGGRINSALRSARLTRDQALLSHQSVVADVLRDVRLAYYAVLMAQQQITVQEASVKLLESELADTRRRFSAGTVPNFNVLRAEVELANARPRLIRARNGFRIAKDNLAVLLGERVQPGTDEVSMELTDSLEARPFDMPLSAALAQAFENRSELAALHKTEALRKEAIASARSGYKPSVQVFAGYGGRSSQFSSDLTDELHGWEAGAQLSWSLFDGFLTKGRVQEAEARHRHAIEDTEDVSRRIDLEVRTAYSSFIEAREVLDSQKKVQESAQEALRLANARAEAGAATQLDVLNAQTALTEARTTQVQALHDYAAARARLDRAIGIKIEERKDPARTE